MQVDLIHLPFYAPNGSACVLLLSHISETSVCTADVCHTCMKCVCVHVRPPLPCSRSCTWSERLTRTCQQDSLRQRRRPVGGRAEGKAGGRDEEVQSERAGQQTHLPHSAPQDVSPKPERLPGRLQRRFLPAKLRVQQQHRGGVPLLVL